MKSELVFFKYNWLQEIVLIINQSDAIEIDSLVAFNQQKRAYCGNEIYFDHMTKCRM